MPRLIICLAALCLTGLANAPDHGWGKTGHCVTGAIAPAYLSPDAATAIADLLGTEDLAEASTWPDFMRASPELYWQNQAGPWHSVTIPHGFSYPQTDTPPDGDAITALKRLSAFAIHCLTLTPAVRRKSTPLNSPFILLVTFTSRDMWAMAPIVEAMTSALRFCGRQRTSTTSGIQR